jgi:hypothetical protein
LRLQRDRAAAGERVVEGGQLVRDRSPALPLVEQRRSRARAADRLAGALQHLFVVGVLPLHQVADDVEQLLALGVGLGLGLARVVAALAAGIVDHLREQHRPAAASGRRAHHRCSVDG